MDCVSTSGRIVYFDDILTMQQKWMDWLDKIRCVKLCCISTFVTKSHHCFVKLQRKGHTQYSHFGFVPPNLTTELNIFNFISFYVYIALHCLYIVLSNLNIKCIQFNIYNAKYVLTTSITEYHTFLFNPKERSQPEPEWKLKERLEGNCIQLISYCEVTHLTNPSYRTQPSPLVSMSSQ